RLSGRAATGPRYPGLPADPLVVHADVRRLLMDTRAFAEGGRATALRAAMVFQQNQIHDLLAELSLYTGHLQEQREENHA
ncbi:MAG: hypothetical protein Q8K65_06160, partial [Alphaproteobacteria bacterium]|nr:hypothetical protein [Alphaproteobacteria bacterium]